MHVHTHVYTNVHKKIHNSMHYYVEWQRGPFAVLTQTPLVPPWSFSLLQLSAPPSLPSLVY